MFVMVCGIPRPAAAQDKAKVELSGGYQFLTAKGGGDSGDEEWENFPAGWYVDIAGNVTNNFALVGQFSGNYKTFEDDNFKLKVYPFMFGVRAGGGGRVSPFGQFLVGGTKLSASATDFDFDASETYFTYQVGAGVNIMGGGGVGARLGVDYMHLQGKDTELDLNSEGVNAIRFNVGIVIGF